MSAFGSWQCVHVRTSRHTVLLWWEVLQVAMNEKCAYHLCPNFASEPASVLLDSRAIGCLRRRPNVKVPCSTTAFLSAPWSSCPLQARRAQSQQTFLCPRPAVAKLANSPAWRRLAMALPHDFSLFSFHWLCFSSLRCNLGPHHRLTIHLDCPITQKLANKHERSRPRNSVCQLLIHTILRGIS